MRTRTIFAITHLPRLLKRIRAWQLKHAEENTPIPSETYLLIRDLGIELRKLYGRQTTRRTP